MTIARPLQQCGVVLTVLVAVLIGHLQYFKSRVGPSGYGYGSSAEDIVQQLDLKGQIHLITGADSGLGYETARVLSWRGAHVVLGARTHDKALQAIAKLKATLVSTKGGVEDDYVFIPLACDLSSLRSVDAAANNVLASGLPLNTLHLTGREIVISDRAATFDGLEMQMGVNFIGHFHLTNRLLARLQESSAAGRVVCGTSSSHSVADTSFLDHPALESSPYMPHVAYGNSMLANILHCRELHERFYPALTAFSVHPGDIVSAHYDMPNRNKGVAAYLLRLPYLKSVSEGAATQVYAAVAANSSDSGQYMMDANLGPVNIHLAKVVEDDDIRSRFWQRAEAVVKVYLGLSQPLPLNNTQMMADTSIVQKIRRALGI